MPNHFENIGFHIQGKEEYRALGDEALEKGKKVLWEDSSFEYYCWAVGKDIELWIALDQEGYIRCFSPYYSSSKIIEMKIVEEVSDNECDYCRGFYAERPDSKSAADMPIIFDMPNSKIVRSIVKLETYQKVELCGFAEEFRYFESIKEFKKFKDRFSPEYYIPCGTFSPRKDDADFKQSAHAILAGLVNTFKRVENVETGNTFYHFTLDNSFGDIDVIVNTSELDRQPKIGGVVNGTFWFTGKVII